MFIWNYSSSIWKSRVHAWSSSHQTIVKKGPFCCQKVVGSWQVIIKQSAGNRKTVGRQSEGSRQAVIGQF